jgi:hypothetical protein
MGMNVSAIELSVLIHDLQQQLRPIRRLNQSGMRTNDHSLHSNSEMNRTNLDEVENKKSCYYLSKTFYSYSPQFLG